MRVKNVDYAAGLGGCPPIKFYYKNWRGEYGYRTVHGVPTFWYGNTQHHKDPQWFLRAFDADKQDFRDFAVNDIVEFIKEI